jgi:hypothetical protein
MTTASGLNRAQRREQAKAKRKPTHTKRSHHHLRQPGPLNAPGLLLAFGQPECTPAEAAQLLLPKRMAFERIRNGNAVESHTTSDTHELAELANLLMLLSERVTDATARQHIEQGAWHAQHACLRAIARTEAAGRFVLDGPGITAIAEALDLYEELLPLIKPAHLAQALADMLKRAQQGHIYNPAQAITGTKK